MSGLSDDSKSELAPSPRVEEVEEEMPELVDIGKGLDAVALDASKDAAVTSSSSTKQSKAKDARSNAMYAAASSNAMKAAANCLPSDTPPIHVRVDDAGVVHQFTAQEVQY